MSTAWTVEAASLSDLARIAELVALKVRVGDVIALHGDLGAGKTTFARALIRALVGDPDAEVPSPTFPIVQPYDTPRLPVAHFDLYRLSGPDDLDEIGFDDACAMGLALIEWPDRAAGALPADRLDVTLAPGSAPDRRRVTITATGEWLARIERLEIIDAFLAHALPIATDFSIAYLQGDASTRAYARLHPRSSTGETAKRYVLMDAPRMPDGPPVLNGLPYSRIAHLAEDVRPFVAIGTALEATGITVPHVHAADLEQGLVLLDDLGDTTFARALASGAPQDAMLSAAVDVLVHLRSHPIPRELALPDGTTHRLPRFDRAALEIEIGLLLDWYWPAVKGGAPSPEIRAEFLALWAPILDKLLAEPAGLFLRDYHSPNLFWLPDREGVRRIGVIDFQDALAEPWSHDLVSLLQDARMHVAADLEKAELDRYCRLVAARDPAFDEATFRATYAAFGAERNTRLIGLWVRLLKRDGKSGYLQHMPRTWDYLARNLAHPSLAGLRAWYDQHFPEAVRKQSIPA